MDPTRTNWTAKLSKMKSSAQKAGKAAGFDEKFRSNFELQVASLLKYWRCPYEFEAEVIPWVSEPEPHKYNPDFKITTRTGKIIYVETKGMFELSDMKKHLAIQKQHPDKDIRFVFSNPNAWYRAARTRSYGKWATSNGFKWCGKNQVKKVLLEWINE